MDPLEWLLDTVPEEVVSCPGGWAKTLAAFVRSLAWKKSEASINGWTSHRDAGVRPAKETQARTRQMNVLASFIRAGIAPPSAEDLAAAEAAATSTFPYVGLRQNLLPERSNAFAHLHLFGPPPDEENEMYQDREERQRLFSAKYDYDIREGAEQMRKEGGELGRAAAGVKRAVETGMKDFDGDVDI